MTLLYGKLLICVASAWMVLQRKSILLSLLENFRLLEKILIDIIQTKKESELSHLQEDKVSGMKKKPLIFISHSSKNKDQVAKIADLLRSINLSPRRDIFCSSLPGYGIPNYANIFDF